MELFETFCHQVCREVRHATPEERDSICRELREHLEDRAEALQSSGSEEEAAAQAAVEAMGDPVEIGRAMNRQYPLGWLILSRLSGALILLLCLYILFTLPVFGNAYNNLRCRISPSYGGRFMSGAAPESVCLTDYRWTVGSSVLRIYGLEPNHINASGDSRIRVYLCAYNQNPFRYASESLVRDVVFLDEAGNELERLYGGSGNTGAWYTTISFPLPEGENGFTLNYDSHGYQLEEYIPLPGEEDAP